MRAFLAACHFWTTQLKIPPRLRKLENFHVAFWQEGDNYCVMFGAKQTGGPPQIGSGTELGDDCLFTVRKKDYKVVKYTFFQ